MNKSINSICTTTLFFSQPFFGNVCRNFKHLFYSAFSIDTWPYLFRVALAFAYDLRRRAGDDECACMGKGSKTFSHNTLVRLVGLNVEVISLLLKCSQCAFHMVCFRAISSSDICAWADQMPKGDKKYNQ